MNLFVKLPFLMLLLITACNKKNAVEDVRKENMQKTAEAKKQFDVAEIETRMELPDCLQEYSDLKRIINQEGHLITIMDKLMISYGESKRVDPCNMPEDFLDGDKVFFSGFIKESPPNVRLAGTPFRLSSIHKKH